jgi:hypothetical protein
LLQEQGVVKVAGLKEIEAEAFAHPHLDFFFSAGRLHVSRSPIGETIAQTERVIAYINQVEELI